MNLFTAPKMYFTYIVSSIKNGMTSLACLASNILQYELYQAVYTLVCTTFLWLYSATPVNGFVVNYFTPQT